MVGVRQPLGFSIRVFLPGGDPDGLKIVEKSNWTGCGVVFPRPLFGEARKRDELARAGVYVLVGPDPGSEWERVYVGEGDPVKPRLDQHAKNKDFWTRAVVFVSKDQNLNKAHVQYLESRLITLASTAKRCVLDNANSPEPPSLSEADTAEAQGFLADMLLCLPVLGYSYFETARVDPVGQQYLLRAKGIVAQGYETASGFVVRQGSQAVVAEVASIHDYLHDLRASLVAQEILVRNGDCYKVAHDYAFASPSTAAGVLLGRSANGRTEWKTPDGQTLKAVQNAQAGP